MSPSSVIAGVSMPRTRLPIVFGSRPKWVLMADVLIDLVCPTASLFVHDVWESRAVGMPVRSRCSSWNWRATRKWIGVRTCA